MRRVGWPRCSSRARFLCEQVFRAHKDLKELGTERSNSEEQAEE
jgi:hypothetical protein